uniref:Venom prothrombin activator porpharin-D n=1 Tax=Pseudechis porphyriacus TaxID=8671 RepID=FAXD_PSEPO|nr:RecName: Full=Venom prothrombin activator porpharin-D; Short=vPA; AltName: Full=Venom coagulation factor Xa-like protease; Contains: RecName: Full=Porpharin-D light chain; Contains: RecName: Full=Porpharin-D heavy chain; Flags: Precursor [Pseudechis porphyriacus]AAX37263.1 factor X-like protease porpharin D precursor [Pseudechis porphyriacus]
MAPQLLLCLILTFLWSLPEAESNVFLKSKEANRFLQRTKRSNSLFEEFRPGNIERECIEEKCSKEEAREIFKDNEKTEAFWNVYVDGDQCSSNPCHYGGTCKDGIGSYTCTCLPNYEGKNCEHLLFKSCRFFNGNCWHFCKPVQNDTQCSCAESYRLGDDGHSCVAEGDFSCGRNIKARNKREASLPDFVQSQNATLLKKSDNPSPDIRIINGMDCKLGECPWQAVLLDKEGDVFCGGTILSPIYVLTAAHCITQSKHISVVVGEIDISRKETRHLLSVDKAYVHTKFVLATYDYDIAIIQLKTPIQFSENVVPACLPTADFANQVLMKQDFGIISGFGHTRSGGQTSNTLKVVTIPYVDRHTCMLSSDFRITPNMFCAGYDTLPRDACQGDSGGPHITAYRDTHFITGIISWGEGCAKKGKYGVYTKVSNFIPWIKAVMRKHQPSTESSTGRL